MWFRHSITVLWPFGTYSWFWAAKTRIFSYSLPTPRTHTFCACVLNFVLEHGLAALTASDLEEMLRFANAAAYLVTTKKGAIRSMPQREQVLNLL